MCLSLEPAITKSLKIFSILSSIVVVCYFSIYTVIVINLPTANEFRVELYKSLDNIKYLTDETNKNINTLMTAYIRNYKEDDCITMADTAVMNRATYIYYRYNTRELDFCKKFFENITIKRRGLTIVAYDGRGTLLLKCGPFEDHKNAIGVFTERIQALYQKSQFDEKLRDFYKVE